MKHLKITSKGWAGYTGNLGRVEFKDGVSVEPVTRVLADRLSGLISFVEVDDEGNEAPTGIAHRLVAESRDRIPVLARLERQSPGDRLQEETLEALRQEKAPAQVYTGEQLETIASEKGMRGLRLVGDAWGVKHRSIPDLIKLILVAQSQWLEKRNKRLSDLSERAAAAAEEAKTAEERRRVEEAEKQAALDAANSVLKIPASILDAIFKVKDVVITAAGLTALAHRESGLSLTGWNALTDKRQDEFVAETLEQIGAAYGETVVRVEPVAEPPAAPADTEEADEIGSAGADQDAGE